MAWSRLQEYYGSAEMIEKALLDRVERFPKISNKDPQKLRELGDLLQELVSAQREGNLPGLTYLDTARGLNPIVEKLPFGLQEKWISQGGNYKLRHKVHSHTLPTLSAERPTSAMTQVSLCPVQLLQQ